MSRIIVDTGPIVAPLNRRDSFHTWSVEQAGILEPPFVTYEAVLAEAHFLLSGIHQGYSQFNQLISSGKLVLTQTIEHLGGTIFTVDSDFHVYRKNQTNSIKLIIP